MDEMFQEMEEFTSGSVVNPSPIVKQELPTWSLNTLIHLRKQHFRLNLAVNPAFKSRDGACAVPLSSALL